MGLYRQAAASQKCNHMTRIFQPRTKTNGPRREPKKSTCPRTSEMDSNDRADFLSGIVDYDHWRVKRDYFLLPEEKWGPHSVDRFANHENTQLPRFNSRFWCPCTEAVDAFSFSWAGENNWLVPPIFLIPKVLNHMAALGGRPTLVVPAWPSAPFWPLIFTDAWGFVSHILEIPLGTDVFVLGNYKNSLFGSPNFRSGVLFLRLS